MRIWNVDLESGSGTWIWSVDSDRWHNGSERGLRPLRYGPARGGKQRLDSRNELLRADLRFGDAGLYIQESHATQNPRPRSNPKQRPKQNQSRTGDNASRCQPGKILPNPLALHKPNSAIATQVQKTSNNETQQGTTESRNEQRSMTRNNLAWQEKMTDNEQ